MEMNDALDNVIATMTVSESKGKCSILGKRGTFEFANIANIDCFTVASKHQIKRLVTADSFFTVIGMGQASSTNRLDVACALIRSRPISLANSKLVDRLQHPISVTDDGRSYLCYDHTIIAEYCKAVLRARRFGKLIGASLDYAAQCENVVIGLADVGLAAIIDEATGYTQQKGQTEYRELFRNYIREQEQEWEKEFPDEFFDEIYKIYQIERTPGRNHPQFFAKFITKYVYIPLANSHGAILQLLDEKDPIIDGTGRRYRLHQFLSEKVGKPALRDHISRTIAAMKLSDNVSKFRRTFAKLFPKAGDQMEFELDDI